MFCILLFYLPFQCRYTHLVKKIIYSVFSRDFDSFLKIDGSLCFYLTDFLMIGMVISSFFAQKLRTLFWEKSRKYLSLFLIISLISILHSPHSHEPWAYYPYLFQLLIPSLFFYALSSHLQIKEFVIRGFWIIFFSSIIECLIAIAQYFVQNPIGLDKLGEPFLFAIIGIADKTRWIFDSFFHIKSLSNEIFRAAGTLPHPNILGCFIGFSLFISFFLYTLIQTKRNRALFTLALFLQCFTLFITYSRAAILGLLLGSLFWFGFFLYKKQANIKTLLIKIVACIGLSALLLFPQLIERGGIINYSVCAKSSDQTRLIYQMRAVEKVKKHSLFGIGFHQYLVAMKEQNEKGDAVHNIYLLIATESGLVGLAAFLCFLFSLIWHAMRNKLEPISVTLIAILVFLLFIGGCHYDLIKSQQERLLFFLSCGLLVLYSQKAPAFTDIKKKQ